jgi:hypothetical protein
MRIRRSCWIVRRVECIHFKFHRIPYTYIDAYIHTYTQFHRTPWKIQAILLSRRLQAAQTVYMYIHTYIHTYTHTHKSTDLGRFKPFCCLVVFKQHRLCICIYIHAYIHTHNSTDRGRFKPFCCLVFKQHGLRRRDSSKAPRIQQRRDPQKIS